MLHTINDPAGPKDIGLRITPDEECQFQMGEMREYPLTPERRTFRTRRPVTSLRMSAGIAKPHWNDGDAAGIVEDILRQIEPVTQAIAGSIGEGPSSQVRFRPWGLAGNEQPRCW